MRAEVAAEYRKKLREFMQQKGRKVQFSDRQWEEVSTYGWTDFDAEYHIHPYDKKAEPCRWIVPEGAVLTEKRYSMFTDTFHSNENEVGINVAGCRCACGKYRDVTLRYVGSLQEVLNHLLGVPTQPEITL